MASSSLTPYDSNSAQLTFSLVSCSETGAVYQVSGNPLSTPVKLEVIRKLTASAATANDHVLLRLTTIQRNTSTGKLATGSITVDISVPKDTATITETTMVQYLGVVASLLNDNAALQSTTVNRVALLEGRDL